MLGLGSSTQLGIGIAVVLQNKFSGEAARINQSLKDMQKTANSAVLTAMGDYQRTSAIIATGAGAMVYGMYNMAKAGAEFQHKINQAFIVGGDNLGKSKKELADYANELSRHFATSNVEIAGALFENTKAGITKGLEEITKYQILAATAAGEPLAGPGGVAQTLLGIMNAYDMSYEEFPRIANAVTAAANATMASVTDIGKAMEYTAFAAKQYNVSLETTLAMTGKLSQSNIRGSSAGTGLANMFRQLSQTLGPLASKKSHAAWSMLGLDEDQMRAMANVGNIEGVIKAVFRATQGMTAINAMGLVNPLFNNRGGRALMAMFESRIDPKTGKPMNKDISSILTEIKQGVAGDVVQKQASAMMDDLWGDIKLLGNAFDRLKASFGKNETFRIFVGLLTKMVDQLVKFAETRWGGAIIGLTAIGASITAITFAFRAAAMAATSTMVRMSTIGAAGGFRGLIRGGLGSVIGPLGRNMGAAAAGNLGYNKAGRLYVTQPFTHAGVNYGKGRVVSGAFATGMGLSIMGTPGTAAIAGTAARSGVGIVGRILPWVMRVGSVGLRIIPILGQILMAVSIISWIKDFLWGDKEDRDREREKKEQMDPMLSEYYRTLDLQYGQRDNRFMGADQGIAANRNQLNQQININIDGKQVMQQSIESGLDNDIDTYLKYNIDE